MSESDRRKKIERILKSAEPVLDRPQNGQTKVDIGDIAGHGNQVLVGNGTIIINDARRPGERIDDDQQEEIRKGINSLVRYDCLHAEALNPNDKRTYEQRLKSFRQKRWNALHAAFDITSFTHLTQAQYDDALQWLDNQEDAAVDRIGPAPKTTVRRKRFLRRPIRLATVLLVVLAVPLLFSVVRTQAPPAMVSGLISAITGDQAPDIQAADIFTPGPGPLTVVPYESVFECHAGCSFFRAPRRVAPAAGIPNQHI